MERPGATTLKGNPLTLIGPELKAGDAAPDFHVVDNGLKPVTLKDTGNQVRIISVVPSLDTPVCDAQTKRFNEEAAKLPERGYYHREHGSAIRPEALVRSVRRGQREDALRPQGRHLSAQATARSSRNCASRAAPFSWWTRNNRIRHAEYVKEVADHPNYEAALAAAAARRRAFSRDGLEVRLNSTQPSPALALRGRVHARRGKPVVRGGLTLVAGVLTGNVLGFVRVALTAYFLGTHSRADSLAVAMGPLDTFNSVLINSVVFAFVPMLTACSGAERAALFLKVNRLLVWVFSAATGAVMVCAPWLMRLLAPGLDPHYFGTAVTILRVLSLSTIAAGTGAVYCALLYTGRRFLPTAFYQAALNVFTIIGALSLWKFLGVYAFAVGYTAGAWAQIGDCVAWRRAGS